VPIPESTDRLFPTLALNHLGLAVGIFFLLGITASSYASADSALAGLTTSFCIDFLNFKNKEEAQKKREKFIVHVGFSLLFLIVILIFDKINDQSVIDAVLTIAGFTYGPLLGLFSFGILTKRQVLDRLVPVVCLIAPAICFMLNRYSVEWFGGYQFGFEILLVNGLLTFIGLYMISRRSHVA
jgi:Na+/proline symporter